MKYSFIVPVYNRPDEVDELLESLSHQRIKDFEVVIVEDGSKVPCKDIVDKYADKMDISYYFKPNSGPGMSRNYGAERAKGEYFIVLDSDCVIPEGYLEAVEAELQNSPADAWGGPDHAHASFTDTQKAINYSMTSFFTTGGIRGGKKKMDKFYPRSFNMGIRATLFKELNGFSKMRFGEDIDFSIRIYKAGARCRLFPEAWVWHKRRTDMKKFYRQVYNFGIARINLYKKYPESLKLVHMLPMVFTVGVYSLIIALIVALIIRLWWLAIVAICPILLYSMMILIDSSCKNKSLKIGMISIKAAFVQLMGYGMGFIVAWWRRCVMGRDEFNAYQKNFYK